MSAAFLGWVALIVHGLALLSFMAKKNWGAAVWVVAASLWAANALIRYPS